MTSTPSPHDPLHIWNAPSTSARADATPEAAAAWTQFHLAAARESIAQLVAVAGPRTVASTLVPFDRAGWHLRMAGSQCGVMFMVHPSAAVRDVAQQMQAAVSAESTALSLNREVYAALQALDVSAEDAATRFLHERALLGYRLSGVDKDEPTRLRIRELSDRVTALSLEFSRRVQDDVRTVTATPAQLAGLPQDFLARLGVDSAAQSNAQDASAANFVTLTTDPPDMAPVMSYAADPALRRAMYLAYNGRGYPENGATLRELLGLRGELARLLGFRSWADLATVDQMMGSAASMRKFLNEVEAACLPGAQKEWAELESFVAQRDPAALPPTLSDARFWEEQFRRAQLDFDSQSVRPYFPFAAVQQGILRILEDIFSVRFEAAAEAVVWAEGVAAFDVFDTAVTAGHAETPAPAREKSGPKLGRIYLDMHPREGKSKWFSECSLVGGVHGAAHGGFADHLPEAALVCNFPAPSADDPGLMQFSDVVTFFHEFGHLMHEILGGRQRWAAQSGIATEGDFVEVPSQMLEEFFDDPDLLRRFALHHETGEPIPVDLVRRMTAAAAHGRALSTLTQVMYATYSLETHDRADAAALDLDALLREGYDRFSRYEFVDGNRMYASFTHLVGYTSNYYTYLFDKVIALEFFSQFAQPAASAAAATENEASGAEEETAKTVQANEKPGHALVRTTQAETALRYRRSVLEPGGSKPARDLVREFLGREVEMRALTSWIDAASAKP